MRDQASAAIRALTWSTGRQKAIVAPGDMRPSALVDYLSTFEINKTEKKIVIKM